MVAQRTFSPTHNITTTRKRSKPTKRELRAQRDLANKQAAWDYANGKTGDFRRYDATPEQSKPVERKSPFARNENGYRFDSEELTDYERRQRNAFGPTRLPNYLAMEESELSERLSKFSNYYTCHGHEKSTDDKDLLILALQIVKFEQLIAPYSDDRLSAQLVTMKRSYAVEQLADRVKDEFLARNSDESIILANWRTGYDYIYNPDDIAIEIPYTPEIGDRYCAIDTRLTNIRKASDSKPVEPDHDLDKLRLTCQQLVRGDYDYAHILPENLLAALKMVKPFAANKRSMKVLQNVRISSNPGKVTLEATNLEIGIRVTIGASQNIPAIDTTIEVDSFAEYIALEDMTEPIALFQWYGDKLSIMQRTHSATFKGIQSSEFPPLPTLPESSLVTIYDVKSFKAACKLLANSVCKEDNRPILTGVNLDYREDCGLYMAASDSYKVTTRTIPVTPISDNFGSFIVPGHTLATLAKTIPDNTSTVSIAKDDKRVFFSWDNCTVVSSLIEGKFPAYETIIPTKFSATGTVDLDLLHKALKQLKGSEVITIEMKQPESPYTPADCKLTGSYFSSEEQNDASATIERSTIEGQPITAKFDYKRLLAIVNEVIKANPRNKVSGYTAKGKPTMKKDTSIRYLDLKWSQSQTMLVLSYNGIQNTVMAIRPEPEFRKPLSYNASVDNDYTWQEDHNDYTAEQNRYSGEDKPMLLLPASLPITHRENLKGIAEMRRRGACVPYDKIESSGVIYLQANYTEPESSIASDYWPQFDTNVYPMDTTVITYTPDPTGWYRRSLQQAASQREPGFVVPESDYSWQDDHNVYPFDTLVYAEHYLPYTCAICEKEVTVKIRHQNGRQFHEECYARMEAYQDKVQARYTRLVNASERAKSESEAGWKRADEMASVIPFGQPILVGHYSEKADRRYRDRIWNTCQRAYEHYQKAERLQQRAEAARRNRAISSDDPAAVVKLREKLAKLEHQQEEFKRVNVAVRKFTKYPREAEYKRVVERAARANPSDPINEQFKQMQTERKQWLNALSEKAPDLAKLIDMGVDTALKLLTPDFMGRVGIPDYVTRNNGAEIRRLKQRIEDLTKVRTQASTQGNTETQHGDIRIVRNVEANRLQIFFPGKPAKETIRLLKQHGFHWSPSEMAWQRMMSNGAEYAAYYVLKSAGVDIPEPK